jgi:hypothetical protein
MLSSRRAACMTSDGFSRVINALISFVSAEFVSLFTWAINVKPFCLLLLLSKSNQHIFIGSYQQTPYNKHT